MSTTTAYRGTERRPLLRGAILAVCCLGLNGAIADAQLATSANYANKFQRTYGTAGDQTASITHPLELGSSGYLMIGTQDPSFFGKMLAVHTETDGAIRWSKTYDDNLSASYEGRDICGASGGNYVIAGFRKCEEPDPIDHHFCTPVLGDLVVTRINGTGGVVWKRAYGEPNFKEVPCAIERVREGLKDKGFIVAGYKVDNTQEQEGDIYLLKLDNDGNVEWTKHYNDFLGRNYVAYGVRQISDGYIVVGRFKESATTGDMQACIFKVTTDGTPVWFRKLGAANSYDAFYAVETTPQGDYMAVGERNGDMYVAKILSNGTLSWSKTYNYGSTDVGYDIKRAGDYYVIAGMANNDRASLTRIQSDGTVSWSKTYQPSGTTTSAMSVIGLGLGYAVAGRISSNNNDFFLVKTDDNGDAGCNTSDISWSATSRTEIATLTLSTLTNDGTINEELAANNPGLTSVQLCYTNVDWPAEEAHLGDLTYVRGFSDGLSGGTSDPTSEPATLDEHAWRAEAIWVRNGQDETIGTREVGSMYAHEYEHERPTFDGGTHYIYTTIHNVGSAATAPGTLEVYWSLSSTSIAWPANWNDYVAEGGVTHGDLAGSVQIPSIPAGESYVAEIPWTTPSSGDVGSSPNVSLLARYVSDTDPTAFPEETNTENNAVNNNNIIWRNDIPVSAAEMVTGNADGAKSFSIRNSEGDERDLTLTFGIPSEEKDMSPLFENARVVLDLGPTLYQRWVNGGATGDNVAAIDDEQKIEITGDDARLEGLTLAAGEEFTATISFESNGNELSFPLYYHYDVIDEGGIGGVTFELEFPVAGGLPKTAAPGSRGAELSGVMIDAQPNPTAAGTTIGFRLPSAMSARLAIYDMRGRMVRELVPETELSAGMHKAEWDGNDAAGARTPTGVYIYRLETAAGVASRQIRLVR